MPRPAAPLGVAFCHEGDACVAPTPSLFPELLDFLSQLDAEPIEDHRSGVSDQLADVGGGGAAGVDDPVGVLRRETRPADLVALEAGGFEQPAGEIAVRVGEGRTGAGTG